MAQVEIRGVSLPTGEQTTIGIMDATLVDPAVLSKPRIIDADGLLVLPGLVDLHTHLREPSPNPAETISTGTKAAAHGGYTAVFAMANTNPVTDTSDKVRQLLNRLEICSAEVIPIGAITTGLQGLELSDLEAMHDLGVCLFSDDGHCVMDATLMRQALLRVSAFGGVIAQHSQDHNLAGHLAWLPDRPTGHETAEATGWPREAEASIVTRDVQLARDTGGHVHICHVSTAESVEVLRWAKANKIRVTAEVTPHHLLLDAELLARGDTTFKVNPPLRNEEDRLALRQGLAESIIDIVATDHAPHLFVDKDKPFTEAKPGMIGLEWALAVVIQTMVIPGLLNWSGVADRMSQAPARIGKISGRQGGRLSQGEPANLILIDPSSRCIVNQHNSYSMGRNNPYHGLDLPDPVQATIWAGQPTYVSTRFEDWT